MAVIRAEKPSPRIWAFYFRFFKHHFRWMENNETSSSRARTPTICNSLCPLATVDRAHETKAPHAVPVLLLHRWRYDNELTEEWCVTVNLKDQSSTCEERMGNVTPVTPPVWTVHQLCNSFVRLSVDKDNPISQSVAVTATPREILAESQRFSSPVLVAQTLASRPLSDSADRHVVKWRAQEQIYSKPFEKLVRVGLTLTPRPERRKNLRFPNRYALHTEVSTGQLGPKAPWPFLLVGKTEEGILPRTDCRRTKLERSSLWFSEIKDGKLQVGNRRP
ncbi:hypothetical protein BJV77DRAFT_1150225 [Russula vinacea]|nr:hypothetical protein BJV77DRAFT_1150225 [Russula vinacea]